MKLSIVLATLLSTFATTVPDLCDVVFLDANGDPVTDTVGQTLARFCEWKGPDVPVWNANVCCTFSNDAAHCTRTNARGRCPTGTATKYCEFGQLAADGSVSCFQPFPDACQAGWCIEPPQTIPEAQMSDMIMCCSAGGACQYVLQDNPENCQGKLLACDHGWVDNDGNIECYD
jgi:hypothetical protein